MAKPENPIVGAERSRISIIVQQYMNGDISRDDYKQKLRAEADRRFSDLLKPSATDEMKPSTHLSEEVNLDPIMKILTKLRLVSISAIDNQGDGS